jgi:hypothetical protein
MTTNLILILLTLSALGGGAFWLYRIGRGAQRGRDAAASNSVKDDQLQAAADAPKSKGELVDRIREKGW